MITTAELHGFAALEGLRFDQTEKDYIILWLLCGISRPRLSPEDWIFKGGTCLRHCYYADYRFSEDIDFTCGPKSGGLEIIRKRLLKITEWVSAKSGLRINVKPARTIPGDFQAEIPIEYSRGGQRAGGLPCVKIHLTFDEPLLKRRVMRAVSSRYADIKPFKIGAYAKEEIIAEKMRSLLQQQKKWPRPRDLYDLWFILCKSRENFNAKELRNLFELKCQARQISPDPNGLIDESLKEWNRKAWSNMLSPMIKTIPPLENVWHDWVAVFKRIFRR